MMCTRDRRDQVALTLDAISKLTYDGEWEIVIVDNGSKDDTISLLTHFAAASARPCMVVNQPRKGSARSRNAGLVEARGDVIAMLDDDCVPAPDWLTQIVAAFATYPDIGYIAGRIELFDQRDAPITTKTDGEPEKFPAHTVLPTGAIHGCNMAFRRALVLSVGGFNPSFGAGARFSGEDVEYATRASADGWAGRYEPSALVYHNHGRRSKASVAALSRRYDVGRGAYYARFALHRRSRAQALRHWYWHLRRVSWLVIARELFGAAEYAVLHGLGQLPSVPPPVTISRRSLAVAPRVP
jgi:GT2 family glycosyltransferase